MKYKIFSFKELVDLGHEKRELTGKLLELVNITLGDISSDSVGEIDQWLPILDNIPECCKIIVETKTGKIVGHWFFTAIGEEMYKEAIKGNLMEINMTIDNVELLDKKGIYYGYFNQIEILKEHRNPATFKMLIESFFEQVEQLSKKEIFFFRWVTLAASKEGEMISRSLGLQYKTDHVLDGKIYSGNIFTMANLKVLSRYPQLVEAYSEIYERVIDET